MSNLSKESRKGQHKEKYEYRETDSDMVRSPPTNQNHKNEM